MVTLEIAFPANRYHATAWGTHVNEGVIEWPPSPWRLLRAMIAAWHWKEETRSEISEETLTGLISQLSESLPRYQLPDAWPGHTRHYLATVAGKKESSTKVFDAFLHVGKEAKVLIAWECDLSSEQREALRILVSKWSYLGRAESLVAARVLANAEKFEANAYPLECGGGGDDSEKKIMPLLVPVPQLEYSEEIEKLNAKKTPTSLISALRLDTADFKKDGWSQPPGSRWVRYHVPNKPPIAPPPKSSSRHSNHSFPTVARFAIVSDVAPSITQALSIGERVHATLVKYSDGHSVFSGTDPETKAPMQGHRHAHIFAESTNHRGTVNFLSIHAPMGFDDGARRALESIKKTWGYGGHDLQVVLLGLGEPEDFGGVNSLAGHSGIFAESRVWQSITPFIPTRHAKATRSGVPKMDPENIELQIGSPEHDLLRLLKLRDYPEAKIVTEKSNRICIPGGDRELPCLKFQRQRKKGDGRSAGNRGYSFRIEFDEPVRGPICAGYGAHFGLGLFVPVSEEEKME